MIRREEAARAEELNERLQKILDLVASSVEHEGFQGAAMGFVTRLATTLECDRVSLGLTSGKHVKVHVMSHTAEFGKQTNLVRAIGAAMDEAVDQNALVVYPPPPESVSLVIKAHEELSKQQGSGAILTIPLEHKSKAIGGLTLERPANKPFDKWTVEACETVGSLVAPILDTKRHEERWLARKAVDSLNVQVKRLLGPGYLVRKIILIVVVALGIFFSCFKIDYRVTANTVIEGEVQRVVAAPFNGYTKEALVRPGDVVKEGALLCLLDDRDLKLERLKWATEKEQLTKQYHEAMAKYERAQITVTRSKIEQAEAQLNLVDEQLSWTRVSAPFNGVVVERLLCQGEYVENLPIMRLAQIDPLYVEVIMPVRVLGSVKVGMQAQVKPEAPVGGVYKAKVTIVDKVVDAASGTFGVRLELPNPDYKLPPGLKCKVLFLNP